MKTKKKTHKKKTKVRSTKEKKSFSYKEYKQHFTPKTESKTPVSAVDVDAESVGEELANRVLSLAKSK